MPDSKRPKPTPVFALLCELDAKVTQTLHLQRLILRVQGWTLHEVDELLADATDDVKTQAAIDKLTAKLKKSGSALAGAVAANQPVPPV